MAAWPPPSPGRLRVRGACTTREACASSTGTAPSSSPGAKRYSQARTRPRRTGRTWRLGCSPGPTAGGWSGPTTLAWPARRQGDRRGRMNDLSGKVALVTGGSRGIGAAIARRLAADGAVVALTYATAADKAKAVAEQIEADGGRALVIRSDYADPAAPAATVEQVVKDEGRLDILVNNAGIFLGGT